jgi:hypothetical protein
VLSVVGHDLSKSCPDMRQRRLTVGGIRRHSAAMPGSGRSNCEGV